MPSSSFSALPTTHQSFLQHRYNEKDRSLGLQIKLTTPTFLPAWASLPTPPMSGTPPPEPPLEPLTSAGRRRKRQDSPPPETTTTTTQGLTTTSAATADVSPRVESGNGGYGDPSRFNRPAEQSIMPFPLNLPWEPQPTYGPSRTTPYSQYPAPPPVAGRPQISPRATRKTKAHVASACVNCKRKHLRCDETRPCRRCVQSGKEDTCKDVEHKKRGRPPLKPDETNARLAATGISLPPLGASSGRLGPASGLVPLLPTPTNSRLPFPPYAAPSVAPSHAIAHGHFATRPPAFPSIHQHALQLPSTGSPHLYGYASDQGVPSSQYSNPLFPRRPVPSQPPYGVQQGSQGGNPFQLPPILPAPPGATVDPAIAQQQRYTQPSSMLYSQFPPAQPVTTQAEGRRESGERESKRPKMDIKGILGPPK